MVLEKVKEKGGSPNPFFLLGRPGRCRATQEKRGKFGGVSGGRRWRAHYA